MTNSILKRIFLLNLAYGIFLSIYGLFEIGLFASIPIHFRYDGEPNGFAPAILALTICPILLLVIAKTTEIKSAHLEENVVQYVRLAVTLSIIALSVAQTAIILSAVVGVFPNSKVMGCLLGLLIILLSNKLSFLPRNDVAGFRIWWNRTSDAVWFKTQRFAGRLGVATGFAIILTSLFVRDTTTGTALLTSCLVVLLVGSLVYSVIAARRDH